MAEAVRLSASGVKSVLGLDPTVNVNPHNNIADVSFVNKFSPAEMKAYLNRLYVRPDRMGVNNTVTAGGVLSYLRPIHEKLSSAKIEAEKLNKLAPEIEQSKILVSSSIMSPNDLQDGEFIFSFNDIPALEDDPDLLKEVTELYNQYFNNVLNLGIKSYDWIGDAMYVSGAKCLLILPIATQIELRHRSQKEANANGYNAEFGFESFKEFSKGNDDYLFSGKRLSLADYLKGYNPSISNLVPSMESFGVKTPTEYCSTDKLEQCAKVDPAYRNRYGSSYITGIENMVINLKAKMSEGDIIRITENTDSFRYINTSKETVEEDIWSKLAAKYGFNNRPVREEMVVLKANPSNYKHRGHPTLIELPTEAVIPIFIPGAPNEHLGYFVMLDEHGQPLTADDNRAATDTTGCAGGSSAATFEAIFGTSCCNASYFNQNNDYTQMGNLIFNNLLDSYIRTRMKGILHRDDLQLSRFNALSTILFQRTLESKETTIVFVPPMLMHYFAFDYDRRTGCGKSKTSDIQFILSLRTTLMMANVVSAVNDAIEHKKIEFGVDDKNANVEAIMELIANIFIEKNKLNGSVDPSEIMRDMYSNSLTIIPKGLPGLSDISVDVQSAQGGSARVDDQTIEQLNNLLVAQLDVPSAALNQLNEPEYARSLVVGNLFFAKKITRYQRIWCKLMSEFIRVYTLVDIPFQEALKKKLALSVKHKVKEDLPDAVAKMKKYNPNEYDDLNDLPNVILNSVSVSLPKPNIVVDKTQFEEISNYINNLQTVADKFFNQEMISSEDTLAQSALPLVKAKWISDQVSKFITEVGSFKMCDIPNFDEIDPSELTSYIQIFQNVGAAINKHRSAISQPSEEGSGFGGDGGFGDASSGGDDFGGGDDFSEDMGSEGGESGPEPSDTTGDEGGESSDFDKLGGSSMLANIYYRNSKRAKDDKKE
jgi:hypothetical protein